jgi:hypothetical protein
MMRKTVVYPSSSPAKVERTSDVTYRLADGVSMTLDVYRPAGAGANIPGALFIHGDLTEPELMWDMKGWGQYRSWGELLASSGIGAVIPNHRSAHQGERMADVTEDIEAALDFARCARGASWDRHDAPRPNRFLVGCSLRAPRRLRPSSAAAVRSRFVRPPRFQRPSLAHSRRAPARLLAVGPPPRGIRVPAAARSSCRRGPPASQPVDRCVCSRGAGEEPRNRSSQPPGRAPRLRHRGPDLGSRHAECSRVGLKQGRWTGARKVC